MLSRRAVLEASALSVSVLSGCVGFPLPDFDSLPDVTSEGPPCVEARQVTETPTPSEAPRTPDVGRLGHVRITNSTRKPQDILAVIRDRSSDSRRCFVERFTLQPTSAEHNNDVQSFSGVAAIGMYVELSLQTARGLQTTFDWPVSRKTQSAVVVIHDDHIEHWFLPLEG